jgi:peptidyl-tRNA hydrolase, PTH1 family
MMLVVGLGNPGPRYVGSPHNVGFRVLDHFAGHHASLREGAGRVAWAQRFEAELAMAAVDTLELVLLKPLTYMNRSGASVRKAMSFFKIPVESALVVHDELDLPLGSLKLKRGGGEAGHNGLKSISAELGARDYVRLRVGVGRPNPGGPDPGGPDPGGPAAGEVSTFLLSPLSEAATRRLESSLDDARMAIALWVRHGLEHAMNRVNRRPLPAGSEAEKPD